MHIQQQLLLVKHGSVFCGTFPRISARSTPFYYPSSSSRCPNQLFDHEPETPNLHQNPNPQTLNISRKRPPTCKSIKPLNPQPNPGTRKNNTRTRGTPRALPWDLGFGMRVRKCGSRVSKCVNSKCCEPQNHHCLHFSESWRCRGIFRYSLKHYATSTLLHINASCLLQLQGGFADFRLGAQREVRECFGLRVFGSGCFVGGRLSVSGPRIFT